MGARRGRIEGARRRDAFGFATLLPWETRTKGQWHDGGREDLQSSATLFGTY